MTFFHEEKQLGAVVEVDATQPSPLVVKLQQCGSVRGRLLNKKGEPLARVLLQLSRDSYQGRKLWSTRTDSNGRFEINSLIPGSAYAGKTQQRISQYTVLRSFTVKPGESKDLGDVTVR